VLFALSGFGWGLLREVVKGEDATTKLKRVTVEIWLATVFTFAALIAAPRPATASCG
jgi:hypothetical protein